MKARFTILFIVLALTLAACGGSETPVVVVDTPIPTETVVDAPILTATPTVPLAVLVLPADMDTETSNLYQTTVYDLTQASGMRFQLRNTFTLSDIEPGLKIVIVFPPDPGIVEIASSAPDVQFL